MLIYLSFLMIHEEEEAAWNAADPSSSLEKEV